MTEEIDWKARAEAAEGVVKNLQDIIRAYGFRVQRLNMEIVDLLVENTRLNDRTKVKDE